MGCFVSKEELEPNGKTLPPGSKYSAKLRLDLSCKGLSNQHFSQSDLRRSNLRGAILRNTNLCNSNLLGVKLDLSAVLQPHELKVSSVVFSSDRRLLAGSAGRTIDIWELERHTLVRTLRGHNNIINSIAFSPDGRYIVSASKDIAIILWEVESGRIIRTLTRHFSICLLYTSDAADE